MNCFVYHTSSASYCASPVVAWHPTYPVIVIYTASISKHSLGCWGRMALGVNMCTVVIGPIRAYDSRCFTEVPHVIFPHYPIARAHGNEAVSMNMCTVVIGPIQAYDSRCFTEVRNSCRQYRGVWGHPGPPFRHDVFPQQPNKFLSLGVGIFYERYQTCLFRVSEY